MATKVEYQIVQPTEEERKKIAKNVLMHRDGCAKVIPGNLIQPTELFDMYPIIKNFQVRESDVFVCSYPKSGSTWSQELVWAMLHNPNLDHDSTKGHPYEKAFLFEMELTLRGYGHPEFLTEILEKRNVKNYYELFATLDSPRIFKSHWFLDFLPGNAIEKAKFVYLIRNPLDTCLSFYHFSKNLRSLQFSGTLDEFVDAFIEGAFQCGSYLEQIKHWWRLRDRKNILTLYYEDLRKDIKGELKKIDRFLGTNLTEQQIENVMEYCSLEEMKKRDPTKSDPKARAAIMKDESMDFMYRKGEVGSSEKELTQEQLSKLKKFFRENLGEIQLPYDLSD